MNTIYAVVIGYFFGSIPWALIIGKVFYKVDIREHGSGNLGGSNAGRVLGKHVGAIVGVLDALKAFIAIGITLLFADTHAAVLAGLAASIGHCYPVFAKFKGGKAVSTAFGYLFGISVFVTNQLLWLFIIPFGFFFVMLKATKIVSLSSMTVVTMAMIISFFIVDDRFISYAMVGITLLVIYRHRSNIKRILDGNENKITWMK